MGETSKERGMAFLVYFSSTSMNEDTSGHLSGTGALHRGARVIILVTLKHLVLCSGRVL